MNTNANKAGISNWEKKYPLVKQGEPTGMFQRANWSAAGVEKAQGAARPLEKRPEKAPSNMTRNIVSGKKLFFRKTRRSCKNKSRKSKSRKSRK